MSTEDGKVDLTTKVGSNEKLTGSVGHSAATDPLSGATALAVYVREVNASTNKVNGDAVDTFQADGSWEWTPDGADVDTAGVYMVYFRGTYPGPVTKRFPSDGFFLWCLEANFE